MAGIWQTEFGSGPLVACAIHDGHEVRAEVSACLALDSAARRYEEDPYTGSWTAIAPTRIVARRSRFEIDLNRPRDKAIYLTAEDAWGLEVWRCPLEQSVIEQSLALYDDFYAHLHWLLERLVRRYGQVVVFDLHSYNHIRERASGRPAAPEENPEINLGTGSMDRAYWAPVVDGWLDAMRAEEVEGRKLDVRENVKFFGGNLPTWVHENFPKQVCALAIEVKKFFMDEWTGELDLSKHAAVGDALAAGARRVERILENLTT